MAQLKLVFLNADILGCVVHIFRPSCKELTILAEGKVILVKRQVTLSFLQGKLLQLQLKF